MTRQFQRFTGLIASVHSPMRENGSLNPERVLAQARHLSECGVSGVYVAGTAGEGASLTLDERRTLAERWVEVGRPVNLKVMVHVGHNSLPVAEDLAAHAAQIGADAICALPPYFFRPSNVHQLVDFCGAIAAKAPKIPFYYHDAPAFTGVRLPLDRFLLEGDGRIPNLAGVHFANPDLMLYQKCLRFNRGAMDILYGNDESLLAGLALGALGAVGSAHTVAAPLFQRLISFFRSGDLEAARVEQARAVQLLETLTRYGYLQASKAVMAMLGVDCGPVRQPLENVPADKLPALKKDLTSLGFFDWAKPGSSHASLH